jgi:hypothetical protein
VSVCPAVVVVVLLSIHPSCHPSRSSKFLIPEEEDDGRGGGGKTPVVLQFAKSYKLIFKN